MVVPNFSDKSTTTKSPKLLDQVRDKLWVKRYSICTEQAYTGWIKRYIFCHGKRPFQGWKQKNGAKIARSFRYFSHDDLHSRPQ